MSDYYERKLSRSGASMRICFWCMVLVAILLIVSFLCSCSTQYVPVESVRTEVVHVHDTILQRDSVTTSTHTVIREARPEDSAMIALLGINLKDNERLLILLHNELQQAKSEKQELHFKDSVRVDSVQVPYPVERKLTKWEQLKIDLGGWMVGIIICSIMIFCIYLARRKVGRG